MLLDGESGNSSQQNQITEPGRRTIWIILVLAVAIILVAFVTFGVTYPSFFSRNFPGIRSFRNASDSMAPTLQQSDHILVNFFTYDRRGPERGEVVAADVVIDNVPTLLIKRVIAVGGDEISISRGIVILNGALLSEQYTMAAASISGPNQTTDGATNFGPLKIPANKYFLLGDNRPESYDSRFYGPIDRSQIKGKVIRVTRAANPSAGWQKLQ
jgi:signal peptidase I